MKADRTVIVFGVFIFLIGLAVAWNGYGYIEVERGWSMVISGTIAFSAGLVLIGLGLILRQLKILSASAAQVALFLAKAGQSGAAAQPSAPQEPAAEAEAVAEQAPIPAQAAPVEQAPAPAAEDFSAPPRPWMTRATTYAAAFGAAQVAEPDAAPAEQFLDENRDWLEKAVAEEVAAQEALFREARVHEAAADEAMAPEAFAHETPADEFPAEQEREEAGFEPPAPNAVYGWEHAVEEPVEEQEQQEIGAEIGAHAPEPAEPPAPHEPAPEPSAEVVHEEPAEPAPPSTPAILGQYEASGARYTMYVDGTIDAETPHGVYRFESMEELKRFLERSA
ncbi:hypothetical protein [Rhodoblastus sp.]|uniref:hypothetical protein n=1 Tax=Rhodoblastus sp. TaxID=1962975 RepID=UPI003F997D7E